MNIIFNCQQVFVVFAATDGDREKISVHLPVSDISEITLKKLNLKP